MSLYAKFTSSFLYGADFLERPALRLERPTRFYFGKGYAAPPLLPSIPSLLIVSFSNA